jgi:hypothetical protein
VIPEFAKALAEYDKNHDSKLSPGEIPQSYGSEWFADSDLNHDGYIDEREWLFYQARHASENCLVAIRGGRARPRGQCAFRAQRGDNEKRFGASFCQPGCQSHRNGSGNTLAG